MTTDYLENKEYFDALQEQNKDMKIDEKFAKVLKEAGYDWDTLPEYDMSVDGYRYFQVPLDKMTHPVMKFRGMWGQPGFAVHVVGTEKGEEIARTVFVKEIGKTKYVNDVLMVFPTAKFGGGYDWIYKVTENGAMRWASGKYHDELPEHGGRGSLGGCPTCPMDGRHIYPPFLKDLLTGNDPTVKLGPKKGDPDFELYRKEREVIEANQHLNHYPSWEEDDEE